MNKAQELAKIAYEANGPENNEEYKRIIAKLEAAAASGLYSIPSFEFKNPNTKALLIADGFKVDSVTYDQREGDSFYGNISIPKITDK